MSPKALTLHTATQIAVTYPDGLTLVYFVGDIAGEIVRRWEAFEVAIGRNVATAQLLTLAQARIDDASKTLARAAEQLERAL